MELDIDIKPIELFEVTVNGNRIGRFAVDSSWEGFVKLRGVDRDGIIIATDDRTLATTLLEDVLGAKSTKKFSIITMSPSLIPPEILKDIP